MAPTSAALSSSGGRFVTSRSVPAVGLWIVTTRRRAVRALARGPGGVEREIIQVRLETGAEIGQELPVLEILFGKSRGDLGHAQRKTEGTSSYQ